MKSNLNLFIFILGMICFANFLQAQAPDGFTWQEVHNIDFGEAKSFKIEVEVE